MTIKSQKLLPSAEIRASKKTISTSLLRDLKPEKPIKIDNVSKESSLAEKFGVIFKFLKKEYKRDRMSWFRERKRKQEERRKKREEELEKNKGKSKIGKGISATLPLKNIFDNISNFLLFLAGGFLLNKILDILPQLMEIGKILKPITIGIYNFGKFMLGTVIGFIDAGYAIHDDLRSKVEELGGKDAVDKFDKFAKQFKKVINGAIILAMLSTLLPKKRRGGDRKGDCKPCQPCICREPQRVPVRVFEPVRIRSISSATEGGYNFDWAKIFERLREPIRNLVKRRQGRTVVNPTIDQVLEEKGATVTQKQEETQSVYATYSLEQALNAYAMNQLQYTELMRSRDSIVTDTSMSGLNAARLYGRNQAALEQNLIQASQLASRIKELDPSWTQRQPLDSSVNWGAVRDWSLLAVAVASPVDAGIAGDLVAIANLVQKGRVSYAFLARFLGPKAIQWIKNYITTQGATSSVPSNLTKGLNVATTYDTQQNLMIFNKTFLQDRYIIG